MNLLAQTAPPLPKLKDIAPAFEIPLLPLWAVVLLTVVLTLLVAWLGWWLWQRARNKILPPAPPRATALAELQALQGQLEHEQPLELTVRIAGVLRKYVMGQYGIPATRQTSYEFLQSLDQSTAFNEAERLHLRKFLEKCDLIEFARFEAATADSQDLWEQAQAFVQRGVR